MSWKSLSLVLLLVLVALLAGGGVYFWTLTKTQVPPITRPSPTPTLAPTATPALVSSVKSDLEQIKELFVQKYNKPPGEVMVAINKNTGVQASGSVKFVGEMGGAMWLAAQSEGIWVLVFDGQGTIPCQKIEPYNFPTDMVPECWDEIKQKLIIRK